MLARIYLRLSLFAVILLWSGVAEAQTFATTRIEMNRYVRGLTNEPLTTYLADTTLNRFIYYSHRTTMLALGGMTDADIDTVITSRGQKSYTLTGATTEMRGGISGVSRRTETNQGGGDVALALITPDQVGRLGAGVIPAHYYMDGEFLVLGGTVLGSDTLFVHYVPLAAALTADGTAMTVSEEDFEAVAFLTASKVFFFKHNMQMGQVYYQMWQAEIALKKGQVTPQ